MTLEEAEHIIHMLKHRVHALEKDKRLLKKVLKSQAKQLQGAQGYIEELEEELASKDFDGVDHL